MKEVKEAEKKKFNEEDKVLIIGLSIIGILVLVGAGFLIKNKIADNSKIDNAELTEIQNQEVNFVIETEAEKVIHNFYKNINEGNYASAYSAFSANRLSLNQFENGFNEVESVEVETISDAQEINENENSTFAKIPLVLHANITGGSKQEFVGAFTLQKNKSENSEWKISKTELYPVR